MLGSNNNNDSNRVAIKTLLSAQMVFLSGWWWMAYWTTSNMETSGWPQVSQFYLALNSPQGWLSSQRTQVMLLISPLPLSPIECQYCCQWLHTRITHFQGPWIAVLDNSAVAHSWALSLERYCDNFRAGTLHWMMRSGIGGAKKTNTALNPKTHWLRSRSRLRFSGHGSGWFRLKLTSEPHQH